MATTIYGSVVSLDVRPFSTFGGVIYGTVDLLSVYPYPRERDVLVRYQNKVWDTVAGQWIYWNTEYPDVPGQAYPGPGSWGTETLGYGVEALVLGRYQKV